MDNVWVANIVTGGTVILVIGWLFNRFVKTNDDRINATDIKAEAARHKAHEIERNYIKRFEEVHEKIDETKQELKDHFTKEINEVIRDKSNYRIEQSRWMGTIEGKIDNLANEFKRKP